MMDYRENAGYIITDSCHVGDSEFVLGVHLTARPAVCHLEMSVTGRTTIGATISATCFPRRRIWWRGRRRRCSAWRNSGKTPLRREAPPYSPWGKVQECETLCPGVSSVSTPGAVAALWCGGSWRKKVFRKEAMGCLGFIASGYLCFEEDNDAQVALRGADGIKR